MSLQLFALIQNLTQRVAALEAELKALKESQNQSKTLGLKKAS